MQFNFGFTYNGVRYGWSKKQLYRLPFNKGFRNYNLKLIKPVIIGSTTCYNLQRNKVTISRVKILTEKVDWKVLVEVKSDYCPF